MIKFRLNLLILFFAMLYTAPALALDVNDIRFGVHPDKVRTVIELSENTQFKTFILSNPYRLVVDLPRASWNVGTIVKPKGDSVQEIRKGPRGQNFRIVIDLSGPNALRGAFVLPATATKPHRLVIDYAAVTKAAFAQEKDRSFGTLDSGSRALQSENPRTAATPAPKPVTQNITMVKPSTKPNPPKAAAKPLKPEEKPLIVIDPGHGGQDPGAIGANKVYEKTVAFSASKELKRQLEATGLYRVKLTRTTDKYLRLHQRVNFARKHEADLFISVHADSIDKPNVRGASVYTLSDKASDAQTARLAARENQADLISGVDLSHEDKEVADILIDLTMRDTMNQSKFFANTLVNNMSARGMRMLPRPHRFAGFAVLKAPDIPSVLVEIGFMSNYQEASMLNSAEYRQKVAASLTDGVNAYFKKVKKNNRS